MDAYAPRIERMMKRLYDSLAEDDRRRYAAIESAKLGHGGVEYISSVLQCDPKTIRRGWRNWKRQPIWTRVVSEKKGWTQKTNRDICRPRSELLQSARGPHRRRSDAGRGEMDELVSGADVASARQIGDSGQSTGGFPIATQERVPQAESPEEENDGPPQSKPQRPVQKDRPPQEAVFEGWPARHQHGYEEEGIARQFLP